MVRQLPYAVVADGGTDRVLQPIIEWTIQQLDPTVDILEPDFDKRRGSLSDFLASYSDGPLLVFVHRDGETASYEDRLAEFKGVVDPRVVPVIPIRMTEAWLLIDGSAIARAAGNPQASVDLPSPQECERMADPKSALEDLLLEASGSPSGRSRQQFKKRLVEHRVAVAGYITDFSGLQRFEAYGRFREALASTYPYPGNLVSAS